MSEINASVLRANMLITDNMNSFDPITNLTKPRIATTYEAMLFTKNGGYFVVDGEKFDISKGTVRFIKPGQEIYSKKYKDAYVIYFNVEETGFNLIDSIPTKHICSDYSENLSLFQSIIKCFINSGNNNYLIYTFLFKLIHNFIFDSKNVNDKLRIGDSAVLAAINYIEYNYTYQITLTDIAKNVNLHPNYFHKLFKNKTGQTPFEYLTELRLNTASDMLITTTHTISEIAFQCGFDNPSYFICVFKKKKGITPNRFRKLHSYDELV